jgi:hypothetical protein
MVTGNHRGQIVGEAAGEENIESRVLTASRGVHVGGRMPGSIEDVV